MKNGGRKTNRNGGSKPPRWASDFVPYEVILGERVLGQPEAVAQAAALMAAQVARLHVEDPPVAPRVLVVGPTSSGKSFLVEQIVQLLNLPRAFTSASLLTPEGYRGSSLSEALQGLIADAGIDGVAYAQKSSLLFVDEVDKIFERGRRDDWIEQIQYTLLPVLGGEKVSLPPLTPEYESAPISFSTRNTLVFLAGVFGGVPAAAWRTLDSARTALKKFGFCDEVISRISHVIHMETLKRKEVERLLEREAKRLALLYQTGHDHTPTLRQSEIVRLAGRVCRSPFGFRAARGDLHQALFAQARKTARDVMIQRG